jgi:hypothetical protein
MAVDAFAEETRVDVSGLRFRDRHEVVPSPPVEPVGVDGRHDAKAPIAPDEARFAQTLSRHVEQRDLRAFRPASGRERTSLRDLLVLQRLGHLGHA